MTIEVNTAPVVTIAMPADGASVIDGQMVSFNGTANDDGDGDLTANLSWTSSLDGAIGSGGAFSTAALSVGDHVITAQATDSLGLTGTAQIAVTVVSSPVEIRVSASTDDAEEKA